MKKYLNKLKQHAYFLTPFLSLEEQQTLKALCSNYQVEFFGGYCEAKLKRAYLSHQKEQSHFNLNIYQLKYDNRFYRLTHASIKWYFYNVGIDEKYLGDIIEDENFFIIIADEIIDIIQSKEIIINKCHVKLEKVLELTLKNIPIIRTAFINSPRLDAVISKTFNMNRKKATNLIKEQNIKINGKVITKPTKSLGVDDVISLRGYGKIVIKSLTYNDRQRCIINYLAYLRNKK